MSLQIFKFKALLLLFSTASLVCKAQFHLDNKIGAKNDTLYLVPNKYQFKSYFPYFLLTDILRSGGLSMIYKKGYYPFTINPNPIIIDHSTFSRSNTALNLIELPARTAKSKLNSITISNSSFEGAFVINNLCYLHKFKELYGADMEIKLLNDTLPIFSAQKTDGNFTLKNNTITKRVEFYNNRGNVLLDDIYTLNYKKLNVQIVNCNGSVKIQNYFANTSYNIICRDDTLSNYQSSFQLGDHNVFFNHSTLINNHSIYFESYNEAKYNIVKFKECDLAVPHLFIENVDTVAFISCAFKKAIMHLNIENDRNGPVNLIIEDTNIDSLDFDYAENLKLSFLDYTSDADKDHIYSMLMEKYKKQNKPESYKNLDIQFRQFTLAKIGFIGDFWSYIEKIWWNYGYSKGWIILWTLVFLFLFFIINVLVSKSLLSFYEIKANDRGYLAAINSSQKNRVAFLFILTVYFFFSFKIDFDRMKLDKTGMMIYFFTQYITGLICLFFLVNAVLKI